jgi:hypothetical protein
VNGFIENLYALRRLSALSIIVFPLVGLSSCQAHQPDDAPADKTIQDELISLDLIGYNYTNYYIDSYSVDGQAGGNIMVSSPTSGGGKVVCCLMLEKDLPGKIHVAVRWQFGGCTYTNGSDGSGRTSENIYSFYKEAEVEVSREPGLKSRNLELHFYQDGSVQARLTQHLSPPRLVLDKGRADKTKFPRCKDDKSPT